MRYSSRKIMKPGKKDSNKAAVNLRLAQIVSAIGSSSSTEKQTTALVLDHTDLGTSRAITSSGHSATIRVTVPNPCASLFPETIPNVQLVPTTVEAFLESHPDLRFDLIYLDFCSSFPMCFDTVERASLENLVVGGTLAYTVCHRGLSREEIAFHAIRHREMARAASLRLDTCVAYRDMVSIVMMHQQQEAGQQQPLQVKVPPHKVTKVDTFEKFTVSGFKGWRVNKKHLEFRVLWAQAQTTTWELAENLVEDLDRATFMRMVHEM